MSACGSGKTGPGLFISEHRVDQEANPGIVKLQCGVTYLSQLHFLLRQINRCDAVCALKVQYKKVADEVVRCAKVIIR